MFLEKFVTIEPKSNFNTSLIKVTSKYFDLDKFTEEVLLNYSGTKEYIQCHNLIKYTDKEEKKYLKYKPVVCHFCCLINDCIRKSNQNFQNKLISMIIDVGGIKGSQFNIGFSRNMINICEKYYADKLKIIVFTNYSKLFRSIYILVKPFIDKDTRKKLVFKKNGVQVEDKELIN